MEYKIRANNQKEAVEVYKAIRQIQQGKHNIAVNADSRKDAVRIYKEAKRVCDSKLKDEDYKLMRAIIDICKKYNYYTYGTLDDYNKLLNRADKMDLVDIATNISVHSDENDSRKIEQILKKELASRGIVVKDSGKKRKDKALLSYLLKNPWDNKQDFEKIAKDFHLKTDYNDTIFGNRDNIEEFANQYDHGFDKNRLHFEDGIKDLGMHNSKAKDSDELKSKIYNLIDYIKSINNATKGKKERYYITDCIIQIQKELINEFNAISHTKNVQANKISMRASIRQMSGYFGSLIKELEAKSKVVNDLTLSQFLHQQANELNSWKQKHFI